MVKAITQNDIVNVFKKLESHPVTNINSPIATNVINDLTPMKSGSNDVTNINNTNNIRREREVITYTNLNDIVPRELKNKNSAVPAFGPLYEAPDMSQQEKDYLCNNILEKIKRNHN